MKIKNNILAFIIFLLSTCFIVGCNSNAENGNQNAELNQDNLIRYHRIIAATPAMEEIVLGLVEPEQMAAVSDYSRKSKFPEIAAKAKRVKGVISTKPSTESIIAHKPDIVLLPVVFGKTQAETLRDCGLHVVPLDVPEGYENIKNGFSLLRISLGNQKMENF